MSDFEEPFKISGMWQCSICTHENTTYSSSCELCGVLHDLSLYFNDISEDEDGGI
jgi:elongation factor 1 alpha-like protein